MLQPTHFLPRGTMCTRHVEGRCTFIAAPRHPHFGTSCMSLPASVRGRPAGRRSILRAFFGQAKSRRKLWPRDNSRLYVEVLELIVQLRLAVVAAQASTEQRVRAEFALVEEKLRRELDTYFIRIRSSSRMRIRSSSREALPRSPRLICSCAVRFSSFLRWLHRSIETLVRCC